MKTKFYYIYSHFDFLQPSAGTTRMLYYAKALADENNKVYLVSCCSSELEENCFLEVEPNIFVLNEKTPTKNFFKIISFVKRLEVFSRNHQGGKSFIYYPFPLISLEVLALLYLKLIKKKSIYCELNEIPKYSSTFHAPISIKRPKYSFKKIVFKTVFTIAEPLIFFYDGIICISTAMEEYCKRFNKNTLRIPVLTDPYRPKEISGKIYVQKDAINIGFSGSIHPTKENLHSFLNVISKIKKEGFSISFNLCGNIFKSYKDQLLEICRQRDEISYYGNLNSQEFSTFLSQQDILVIPRGYSLQNKYGFSTKLSDYLNHEKIIILTDISDNGLYIKDGLNGFIVPPDNEEEMYKKLKHVIENLDDLKGLIVPNAIETSKLYFHYLNYREALREFIQDN